MPYLNLSDITMNNYILKKYSASLLGLSEICKIIAILVCMSFLLYPGFAQAEEKETAFDRVINSGKLRCGYVVQPPVIYKDLNTGEISGWAVDLAEEIGKRLSLDIEWTEEVTFPTMHLGLQYGRYDAVCLPMYRQSEKIRVSDFTYPFFYTGTGVYVRSDDDRFNDGLSAINSPDVILATIDGEMSQYIAERDFPNAKVLSLPELSDITQNLKNIETNKADVAFVNNLIADGYLKANPDKLENIAEGKPVRIFSHGYMVPKGEYDFVRMLNLVINEMHDHGAIKNIMDEYDPAGNTIFYKKEGL